MSTKKISKVSLAILTLLTLLSMALLVGTRPAHAQGLFNDRCIQGYVWREAVPGDKVCVTPGQRDIVWADNAAAASRIDPNGAWGKLSCKQGFVWRLAVANDLVCVTPQERDQVAYDNSQADSRRAS